MKKNSFTVAKIKTTECCFYRVKPHRRFSFEKQGVCGAECIEARANDYATVEVLISTKWSERSGVKCFI